MVPNIDGTIGNKIKTRKHPRQCGIQSPTNRNPVQSLEENAITPFGPGLYNSLPKYLKDIESVQTERFKSELCKFNEFIPDGQEAASSTSNLIFGITDFTPLQLSKYITTQ